jgi:hypothetical protein
VVNLVMASQRQLHEAEMSCREYGGGRMCSEHSTHTPRSEEAHANEARKGAPGSTPKQAGAFQKGFSDKASGTAAGASAGSSHLRQQEGGGSGQA